MKITITRDNYTHTADLTDKNDLDRLPSIEDAVDAALYLLSLYYDGREVQNVARR